MYFDIYKFVSFVTSKIKDISTFGTIIEIIDTERIKDKDKIEHYYNIFKNKYDSIIKNDIKIIKEEDQLKEAVKILSYFISRLFLFEGNNDFLDDKISKLDNRIRSLIYNELIRK